MHTNLQLRETTETTSQPKKAPYLITEQTWDGVYSIANNIDQTFNEISPSIVIGNDLIFFPLNIPNDKSGKLTDLMRGYAQSFMEQLKSRFAPRSRIQVKKRQGIYKLEWKAGNGEKIHILATIDDDTLSVKPPQTDQSEEFLEYVTGIYEAARTSELYSDRYNEDGIPIGSGKGSQVTISGETAESSPFLERPDLLMSLITYWQNHPSLSYLFSGDSIGPMGRAPRVDEVRKDALYELDIASRYIPKPGYGQLHPEIIDQIFRHKLVDSFRNMSGAEICIDKLFPIDNSEGQLGAVSLRCFEMVPDPKLLMLQQLLVKAIITRCSLQPYCEKFINWGASLQNEFMLPYFIELDFKDLLLDLSEFDYTFKFQWFAAQFARRFPQLGRVTLDDVELDLSIALEPQNVYSNPEAASCAMPPQFQRLQLKTKNLDPDKHAVTCNGFLVPLTDPDTHGTQVASIRLYKSLPKLPSNEIVKRTPNKLTFELIEKESRMSLGGFLYKMTLVNDNTQGQFIHDPVLAREKRLGSFDPFIPYEGGEIFINPAPKSYDMPNMLDLRKV